MPKLEISKLLFWPGDSKKQIAISDFKPETMIKAVISQIEEETSLQFNHLLKEPEEPKEITHAGHKDFDPEAWRNYCEATRFDLP